MLEENIKRRLTAIAIQLELADRKGVSNIAKSSYYRSAAILTCTVVEGLVFEIVRKNTSHNGNVLDTIVEHTQIYNIPKTVFSTYNDLSICLKNKKDLLINDNGVTFGKLNIFLKNNNLVTGKEYKEIEKVRKERNKLHLQSISGLDTGYTKSKVQKLSKPLSYLVSKI